MNSAVAGALSGKCLRVTSVDIEAGTVLLKTCAAKFTHIDEKGGSSKCLSLSFGAIHEDNCSFGVTGTRS